MSAPAAGERWCEFGPLRVGFDDSVLAPRPWTLVQSRRAAALLERAPPGPLLELHCGAGHIGQVAAVWSGRPLVQIDDDPRACRWARRNAAANGVTADIRCVPLEELTARDEGFELVLLDPPYVPSAEISRSDAEPRHAIDGGADGLDGIRTSLPVASRVVRRGGTVVLQVRGAKQADAVRAVVVEHDLDVEVLHTVTVAPDRAVVVLRRPS